MVTIVVKNKTAKNNNDDRKRNGQAQPSRTQSGRMAAQRTSGGAATKSQSKLRSAATVQPSPRAVVRHLKLPASANGDSKVASDASPKAKREPKDRYVVPESPRQAGSSSRRVPKIHPSAEEHVHVDGIEVRSVVAAERVQQNDSKSSSSPPLVPQSVAISEQAAAASESPEDVADGKNKKWCPSVSAIVEVDTPCASPTHGSVDATAGHNSDSSNAGGCNFNAASCAEVLGGSISDAASQGHTVYVASTDVSFSQSADLQSAEGLASTPCDVKSVNDEKGVAANPAVVAREKDVKPAYDFKMFKNTIVNTDRRENRGFSFALQFASAEEASVYYKLAVDKIPQDILSSVRLDGLCIIVRASRSHHKEALVLEHLLQPITQKFAATIALIKYIDELAKEKEQGSDDCLWWFRCCGSGSKDSLLQVALKILIVYVSLSLKVTEQAQPNDQKRTVVLKLEQFSNEKGMLLKNTRLRAAFRSVGGDLPEEISCRSFFSLGCSV